MRTRHNLFSFYFWLDNKVARHVLLLLIECQRGVTFHFTSDWITKWPDIYFYFWLDGKVARRFWANANQRKPVNWSETQVQSHFNISNLWTVVAVHIDTDGQNLSEDNNSLLCLDKKVGENPINDKSTVWRERDFESAFTSHSGFLFWTSSEGNEDSLLAQIP